MPKTNLGLNDPPITLEELNKGLEKLIPAHEAYIRESEAQKDQKLVEWLNDYLNRSQLSC